MLLNQQGSAIEANDGNAITDPIPSEHQLRSDVAYINSMLTKLGMDCPLALLSLEGCDGEGREGRRWELGQAISVLIPLLQTRIREQAFRSEVEDRVRRLAEDLQEKTGQFEKQQSRSDDLQRQLVAVKEELRASQQKCSANEAAASKAREESNRLRTAFQLKEKQFIHELRKKEHEFDRLKEQLQSHFNKEILSGTALDRAELARLSLPAEAHNHRLSIYGEMVPEEELVAETEEPLVDRLAGLEDENEQMRALLMSIQQLLQELGNVLELDEGQQPSHNPVLEAAISGMPSAWIVEDLKKEIETSLTSLSKRVAQLCGIDL